MRKGLADRVAGLRPSAFVRSFDLAATMDDVVSLTLGEPDFDTPANYSGWH